MAMTVPDSSGSWTRELANLRTRALKLGLRCAGVESPLAAITEEALTACAALLEEATTAQSECERLRAEVPSVAAVWEQVFDVVPVPSILSDDAGLILSANAAAGVLLNCAARHLKQRELIVFSEQRDSFRDLFQQLWKGEPAVAATITIRPRDRKTIRTRVTGMPLSVGHSTAHVWFLQPCPQPQQFGGAITKRDDHEHAGVTPMSIIRGSPGSTCHRCGASTDDGPHSTERDCIAAIDREMRALKARTKELSSRRMDLATQEVKNSPHTEKRTA
jgi:PAS domain-containing protein